MRREPVRRETRPPEPPAPAAIPPHAAPETAPLTAPELEQAERPARRRRRGGRGRGGRAPRDAAADVPVVAPAESASFGFDDEGSEEPTKPVADSFEDREQLAAAAALRAEPVVRLDADGWPMFDEQELPEESVRPEQEPPTEEVPVLDAADVARGGFDEAVALDERRPDDRRPARGPLRGRGRAARPERPDRPPRAVRPERMDALREPPPAGEPDVGEPAPPRPEGGRRTPRPESGRGVLHFFRPERLDACQRAIGYWFRDLTLLENALTHSSIKSDDRPSYERLEFLGDSVVGLVMSDFLYTRYPDFDEGELTKVKSIVVSTEGLANAAKVCGLERFLAVGRGLMMKEAVPRSLIADVFEGVVGAVYLDRGYESARLYVLDHLTPFVDEAMTVESNFKSVLQQVAQRDYGETPHYDLLREWGPEHARNFEVVAVLGRRRFPPARAATKKDAEQAAARIAFQLLMIEKGHGARRKERRRRGRPGPRDRGAPPSSSPPPDSGPAPR